LPTSDAVPITIKLRALKTRLLFVQNSFEP
jgi:hypothetical protein